MKPRIAIAVLSILSLVGDLVRHAVTWPWVLSPVVSALGAGLLVAVPGLVMARRNPRARILAAAFGLLAWHVPLTVSRSAHLHLDASTQVAGIAAFAVAIAAVAALGWEGLARRRPRLRALSPLLPTLAVIGWLLCGTGTVAVSRRPKVEPPPDPAWLAGETVEPVAVHAADGARIEAWLVRRDPRRCVLLLGGIGEARRTLVPRAGAWLQRGRSVLLADLRGTGASEPRCIAFGWDERLDVEALWKALAARGFTDIGVHAHSLGGAAFCYAVRDGLAPAPSFAVLEAVYDDLQRALTQRLPWVPAADVVLWPVVAAGEQSLGVAADALRPVEAIAALQAPTLLVQGELDAHVGRDVPARLRAACGSTDVTVAWIAGEGHVDLWRAAPDAYRRALDRFLAAHR